jgi:hypothetical protein
MRDPAAITANVPGCLLLCIALLSLFPGPAPAYETWINCGGPSRTVLGTTYEADTPYEPEGFGHVGGQDWSILYSNIGGIDPVEEPLYEEGRRGFSAYRFDVPAGSYAVTLGLNETEYHGPGFRAVDVAIEGNTVLSSFDLAAYIGRWYAVKFHWLVTVTDGTLDLAAHGVLGQSDACVIGVVSIQPDTEPPPAPASLVIRGSYGRNLLDWDQVAVDDLAGYLVYRQQSPLDDFVQLTAEPIPVYRYLDDDVTVGESETYRVTAVDLFGNESAPSAGAATPIPIDSSDLSTAQLTIDDQDLYFLNTNVWSDEYVPAVFEIDGVVIDAETRYRGSASRLDPKKSFRVRTPSLISARERFNLCAEFGDAWLIRNTFGYEFFAGYTPTPQTRWIHLRVNGQFAGVYSDIENLDEHFLIRVGLDDESALYKTERGTNGHLGILPSPSMYETTYSKRTGPPGHDDLIEFIHYINYSSQQAFVDSIGHYLEVDEFLDYYAVVITLSRNGFCCNNYFIYHDLDTGKWSMLPWDNSNITTNATYPLDFGTSTNPTGEGYNYLIDRVMSVPALRYAHSQRLLRLLDDRLNMDFVGPLVSVHHDSLTFDVERDFWKRGREDPSQFHQMDAYFADFVGARRTYVQANIYAHMPELAGAGALFVNEVMADNETTIADEAGDFDDWIEIYNHSAATLYLGGMFLTDDLARPQQWAFPDTSIGPGEFLLVWADDEPGEGPLHATFRLSAGGEVVGLFDVVENGNGPIDQLAFPALGADQAFGRLPDGGGATSLLDPPTPGGSNTPGPNQPPVILDVVWIPEFPDSAETVTVTAHITDDHGLQSTSLWFHVGLGWTSTPILDDGMHGDGAAGDGVFGAFIDGQDPGTLVAFFVSATDDSLVTTVEPPGAPTQTFRYLVGYDPPLLYLNELLASNETVIPDEAGEYDDWFEIYNAGWTPVSTGGLFVTDNLDNRTKWALPDTTLPPRGILLLWADDDLAQGTWHVNFKLDADGEELGLFDSYATGWARIDSVTWGPQTTDISLGREPDGGPIWRLYSQPTPGELNTPEIGVEPVAVTAPQLLLGRAYPNPVGRRASIPFWLANRGEVDVSVYAVRGSLVRRFVLGSLGAGRHQIDWDGRNTRGTRVASGIYFIELHVRDTSGTHRLSERLMLVR